MKRTDDGAAWRHEVGMIPNKVTAFEDVIRKGVVYLKWRVRKGPKVTDWKYKSLGFTIRNDRGGIDRELAKVAITKCQEQYDALIGKVAPAERALSLSDGLKMILDEERGKYPARTPFRDEIERSVKFAMGVLGSDKPWTALDRGDVRAVWRRVLKKQKAAGRRGVRTAYIVVSRLFTVALWLIEEHKVAVKCLPWTTWREELEKETPDYEPHQPRFTREEVARLHVAAPKVDERFALLFSLAAEYRLGQAATRIRRSDINLDFKYRSREGKDTVGVTVRIRGRGKKGGALVLLTRDQEEALRHALTDGYLAGMEENRGAEDYYIIPGEHLPKRDDGRVYTKPEHRSRGPVTPDGVRDWFMATEVMAKVPHVKGRGWYGVRREKVDRMKELGVSREALMSAGGWSDPKIPDKIYADQEMIYAAEEARDARAVARNEGKRTAAKKAHRRSKTEHAKRPSKKGRRGSHA